VSARDLVRRARAHARLSETEGLVVTQEEIDAVRRRP
jgi:hypothetical protein